MQVVCVLGAVLLGLAQVVVLVLEQVVVLAQVWARVHG